MTNEWADSFRLVFPDLPMALTEVLIAGVQDDRWTRQFAWAIARSFRQKAYNARHASELEISLGA